MIVSLLLGTRAQLKNQMGETKMRNLLKKATIDDVVFENVEILPTSRVLYSNTIMEWVQYGKIDNVPVVVYYITPTNTEEEFVDWMDCIDGITLDYRGCHLSKVTDDQIEALLTKCA